MARLHSLIVVKERSAISADPCGVNFNFDQQPFIVIWEVTRACALACRHCRAEAVLRKHPLELTTQESFRLIDQVARAKPTLFVLTGGDPALRSDLQGLIYYAAQLGLRVGLSPSATPEFLRADFAELKKLGVARISLSLDGATRESHDRFRGVPGTWELTMEAIARAAAVGLPVQINTTFTRQNVGEFDTFVDLLARIRPVLWSVFQLVPTGRGKMDDLLTADELEELFLRLQKHSETAPYDIKTTEGQHYRRVVLQQTKNPAALRARAPLGINDGKGFVFISHTGDIQPSGFLPITAGNVRKDELLDVYQNAPLFRNLRDTSRLEGKCGICEFKNICGGSRARAFAMTGSPFGAEPLCAYQPQGRIISSWLKKGGPPSPRPSPPGEGARYRFSSAKDSFAASDSDPCAETDGRLSGTLAAPPLLGGEGWGEGGPSSRHSDT